MTAGFLAGTTFAVDFASPSLAVETAQALGTFASTSTSKRADSMTTAKAQVAETRVEAPQDAESARLSARAPYQRTEGYRFSNAMVDDWLGKLSAWSLGESVIDYVDATYAGATSEEEAAAPHVIATPVFELRGEAVDACQITPELLESARINQTRSVERVVAALGLEAIRLESSQSLDNSKTVFQ